MKIKDIIGKDKAFEPPFRRRGKNVKDKNLRTLFHIKASGTLRYFGVSNIGKAEKLLADYLCKLLNKEYDNTKGME